MEGRPSDVARALTMAVTIIAKRRHRQVIIVRYGNDELDSFVVKNLRKQRRALNAFLSYGCAGGNNEDELFGTVFRELIPRDREFTCADILCVSDFFWAPVSESVLGLIRANKAKGMKFYGLAVSLSGEVPRCPIIDNMWVWDEKKNLCHEVYGGLAQ